LSHKTYRSKQIDVEHVVVQLRSALWSYYEEASKALEILHVLDGLAENYFELEQKVEPR
jgi:hypothetical protein